MNPLLSRLQPYPFERLARLKQGINPPTDKPHIALSIGEPQHPAPDFVTAELIHHLSGLSNYPVTKGTPALRQAMAAWAVRRFGLKPDSLDPERHILPVNGTREALFSFAQCVIDPTTRPLVLMPNPFYQIYEGAAFLGGAEPYFLNTLPETGFLPDYDTLPEAVWQRCQLLYLSSPGNPTGAVTPPEILHQLIDKADQYDFILAADECYSEIFFEEDHPPAGLLQVCAQRGRDDYRRCMVFNSLSKRSNLPGLRSGFVAGDADILKEFLLYRTYHGSAMPLYIQAASHRAWMDERHVRDNRQRYRRKFKVVLEILAPVLEIGQPEAAFFLWPRTPIDDTEFTRRLFAQQNVTVLPGSFLSRQTDDGINPGHNRVRMALVAPLEECVEAAQRIREFVASL